MDSFYYTPEELAASPSRAHGITQQQEDALRVYGAQMIQEAGALLKCPQVAMATGQILLQRFYCKRSLMDWGIKVRHRQLRRVRSRSTRTGMQRGVLRAAAAPPPRPASHACACAHPAAPCTPAEACRRGHVPGVQAGGVHAGQDPRNRAGF